MSDAPAPGPVGPARSRAVALAALEQAMGSIDRARAPEQWALAAYRLAVALTEAVADSPARAAARSLDLLDRAAVVLDRSRAPLEHARLRTAAGMAHRLAGDPAAAYRAFLEAAELLTGRARPVEVAAAWSNAGLARAEAGDPEGAVAVFGEVLDLLGGAVPAPGDPDREEWARARLAAVLNRAQAVFALEDTAYARHAPAAEAELASVIEDPAEGPPVAATAFHLAMLEHTLGLFHMRNGEATAARDRFGASLRTFTLGAFPFQHAVARFNRGRAHERIGELRAALVDLEAATVVFDPRLQRGPWLEASRHLVDVERRLGVDGFTVNRMDLIVAELGRAPVGRRRDLVRERLERLLGAADEVRRREVTLLVEAALRGSPERHDEMLRALLETAMELPDDMMRAVVLGILTAHRRLVGVHGDAAGEEADRRLDRAIQELVMGPQRVRMREVLYGEGWSRP